MASGKRERRRERESRFFTAQSFGGCVRQSLAHHTAQSSRRQRPELTNDVVGRWARQRNHPPRLLPLALALIVIDELGCRLILPVCRPNCSSASRFRQPLEMRHKIWFVSIARLLISKQRRQRVGNVRERTFAVRPPAEGPPPGGGEPGR